MNFKAVFFDLGGTLFRYGDVRGHFDEMLRDLARQYAIEAPFEEIQRAYREAMASTMAEYGARPYYLHREMFTAAYRELLARFDRDSMDDDALYRGQSSAGVSAVTPRRGVTETLAELRARGLHLGIVSNIDDDQFEPLWEQIGLGEYFDATTTSEEARSCKPDAGIYRHALAKAPGVSAEQVVFVGDSPSHDVVGARRLGMTTVWITSKPRRLGDEQQPHHTISEIPELLEILGG
jgi:2-haloalkanoic acid dehalogenase type II